MAQAVIGVAKEVPSAVVYDVVLLVETTAALLRVLDAG